MLKRTQEQEADFCPLTHKWSKVVKKHKNKSLYPLQKFFCICTPFSVLILSKWPYFQKFTIVHKECLQYGLPLKIDYHKKIQNGLPFQIIIRKVVYFEDINCLKWTTITSL